MKYTWTNWSKLQRATPAKVETPWTSTQLQRAVREAIAQGSRMKAIGAGHSFTGIAVADDIQLDLSRYTGMVALDPVRRQVTLRAGTRLWQIPQLLADTGLALQNLGDINRQSIAGAISTSTHGTGLTFGGLASQVVGCELITGTGEVLTVSQDHHPELLDALRVTLGAFGILTTVTLQLVPAYDMHTVERHAELDWVLEHWDDLNTDHDHFEFFWFGHDREVITKASTRLPVSHTRPTRMARLRERAVDEVVMNMTLAGICQLGRVKPGWVPHLNRLATLGWGSSTRRAHWSTAFTSDRRVRFNEMEYALPFAAIPEVLAELRQLYRRGEISSTYPMEVRSAAADTAWLATNHGRRTGYIAVHQHFSQDHRQYFARIEPIFRAAGGRPHWGKLHSLTAQELATLYPCWDHALALRDELDPNRVFANAYLTRVFGT
ncbi:D-arabinono-1,4-lactone oxidase [Enteractinococcus fodinae]|nr:D-arabinono-1,4-lactone oxidase [Enteractinococcus fodinae]